MLAASQQDAPAGSVSTGPVGRSLPLQRYLPLCRNRSRIVLLMILCTLMPMVVFASASGIVIENTATATHITEEQGRVDTPSNTVRITTVPGRTVSVLTLMQYTPSVSGSDAVPVAATGYSVSGTDGGPFESLPPPIPVGETDPIDLGIPVPWAETQIYHQGEPVFLRLVDRDQNLDPLIREAVLVRCTVQSTAESEYLLLTETEPDAGVFSGYVQSASGPLATANDGVLSVFEECRIVARYVDALDPGDHSESKAWVDPVGVVFDSRTGEPVDGAIVTLVDTETGRPAVVLGNDGRTDFPSSVPSGGRVEDGSGKGYSFGPGEFRFPFVGAGRYRIDVTAPAGFAAPSTMPTEEIQSLPGAPFAIDEAASRGGSFVINPGPTCHFDIPVDRLDTGIFLSKTAGSDNASIGDFVQYSLRVDNIGQTIMTAVSIEDRLPPGFRYESGSTLVDGAAVSDPGISSDGRTLTFSITNLAASARAEISYVVEIAAGTRPGHAANRAIAAGSGGVGSNVAEAVVEVHEDLFRSSGFVVGSVTANGCAGDDGSAGEGVSGVRIYLEDGTYVVTDQNGNYHFEGVRPGMHVVQLDLDGIPAEFEVAPCEMNGRFAGRAFSQLVDLQAGTMWRADFNLARKPAIKGEVQLELESSVSGREVDYRLGIRNDVVTLENLRLTILLPDGVKYLEGSGRIDGVACEDPSGASNALVYRFGSASPGWTKEIEFTALVETQTETGLLSTRGLLMFDTPAAADQRTPVVENTILLDEYQESERRPDFVLHPRFDTFIAELSEADAAMLDDLIEKLSELEVMAISVEGHTDNVPIAVRSRHIFPDNYALSEARASSVARYIADGLHLPPSQISMVGRGADEPVASNETAKGRSLNRRVELRLSSRKISRGDTLEAGKPHDHIKHETTGREPFDTPELLKAPEDLAPQMPVFDEAWFESVDPGLSWIWPADFYCPPIPSLKVAVKHHPDETLVLLLNGKEVSSLNFSDKLEDKGGVVAVSRWRGIDLREGDNQLEVIATGPNGSRAGRLARTVHYSSPPVHAEFVQERSYLAADGRNIPVIAVRLLDKDGYPARQGVIGTFTVDPPYRAKEEVDELDIHPLSEIGRKAPRYVVGADGIALVKLEETSRSGEVVVRFIFTNGEQEIRAWLHPADREWILVGLAEGTLAYNTITNNMETAAEAGIEEELYEEGRVALFAKGRIQGKWLLTFAYDSEKRDTGAGDGLFGTIDPDEYYTLYGDRTQQIYEAPSSRKLYLKIERRQFYTLFGDYLTGLTVTELTRYNRSFNGLKSELRTSSLGLKAFASRSNQAFVKDEIRGDGTSGLYRLSRSSLVVNSEQVIIETRDRFRSELIVSSRGLTRHIDYDIDYETGDLFFKEPVPSKDADLNPIFIVVDYESNDESDESYTYGGRAAWRDTGSGHELGGTYVHEGRTGGDGDLFGVDATVGLSRATEFETEFARTNVEADGAERTGDAYRAELIHRSGRLDGRAYFREQDGGFGLGQQNSSESGTRKFGLDAIQRFNERFSIGGKAYRQMILGTDAERDVGEASLSYTGDRCGANAGYRHARDELGDGSVNRSEQITAGGSCEIIDDRLRLRMKHDQSLESRNANRDFPTRTLIGTDYEICKPVTAFAEQEFTSGKSRDTRDTRLGLKAKPWTGAAVHTSVERRFAENSSRLFANLGLKQTWQVTDRWMLDAGLDHSQTKGQGGASAVNPGVPPASGSTRDFTAVSFGAAYRELAWSTTSRIEARVSDLEERSGIIVGIHGEPARGLGLSAGARVFRTDTDGGAILTNSDIRLGFALRPAESRWVILDRLDLVIIDSRRDSVQNEGWRIVNNLNANCRFIQRAQLSLQYGSKYVRQQIESRSLVGYTDLVGLELRYDLSRRWDFGVRGSVLHSWNAEMFDYGAGLTLGYNVIENAWIGVGYNVIGFEDGDFGEAGFTAQGPVVRFITKIDQQSLGDAVGWLKRAGL